MKPATTRTLVFAGLAATLALAWLAPSDDTAGDGAAAPAVDKARRARPAAAPRTKAAASLAALADASPEQLITPERALQADAVPDLFKAFSWVVAPPPPPPPPPPAPVAPSAPPLPFAYLGQYSEGTNTLILLTQGDRLLTVSIGAVIDRNYRLQSLSGGRLTFLYLPLQIEQSLMTGVSQ